MTTKPGYLTSLLGLASLVLIGAALYFLLVEHGAHTLPYLPFLIILIYYHISLNFLMNAFYDFVFL